MMVSDTSLDWMTAFAATCFHTQPLSQIQTDHPYITRAGLGTKSKLICMSFFICLWFDTKMDGLWLMNAQKGSPFECIHEK